MDLIINQGSSNSNWAEVILVIIALIRVYLEVINFNFNSLPLTAKMGSNGEKVHRFGLIMAVGVIVLFSPSLLLG
ncbi:MAG: hypothetical protein HOE90_15825 [Bacteriovoracaceae bacterium]|jgi:hypothetical protein|nr:hypothetical protein [Bacteriovoracaceae bacterium]